MVWTKLVDQKDKTTLPNYLKDLYKREPQQVDSLLSKLINPKDSENKFDSEKCLWVICGGQKPDDFTKIIKANDRSVICGLVWDANFIAYRCKTCGITPCMSLCAECFENGNHEGHDFNMFKSGAGGACDCGDIEVMKACGFCSRHGPKSCVVKRNIPSDITLMVELVVPKLIQFLVCKLEDNFFEKHEKIQKSSEEVKDAAALLLQLCEMGDVTRKIVADHMLNRIQKKLISSQELSSKIIVKTDVDMPPYNVIRRKSSKDLSRHSGLGENSESSIIQAVEAGPSKDCDISYLVPHKENETILEKLIDLLIELKFPQFLVTLVLSMLQETEYKKEFMKAFCQRYSKIANLLTHRFEVDEDQKLCNRLVHASVQLFSNENLTYTMVEKNNLLSIIVTALSDLISRTLIKLVDDNDNINKTLFVVNCDHDIIRHHRYWPIVSDFHNLLSHSKISRYFLQEPALIRRWMGILIHFTGMNKNIRQLIVHVAYESMTYQLAYSSEIETSSHIMMNLLAVCNSPADKSNIRLVLSECVRALRSWFRMIQVQIVKPFLSSIEGEDMTTTGPIPRHEISFHLPLHRYLAAFIAQGVNYCGLTLEEALPSEEVLWCVVEHVLRIQVGIGEILAGLWVRNGFQLRSQEELYLQGQYCNVCVDLDIFLLQVCAMTLDSDKFLKLLLQRYKLEPWFEFGTLDSGPHSSNDEVQQVLVENMLNLILQLVYQRMYMGLTEEKIVHLEVVTKLTMGDFTHSQLTEHLPEKPGLSELTDLFDRVLSKVSDYKEPSNESGHLTQGIYALKPDLWKSEFQPLHVMLRGSYKRGYQLAMDKYKGWYQSHNKAKVQGLWPPFRKPLELNPPYGCLLRLLKCRTLHAILFTLLYKAIHEKDAVTDNMVYLTFYLIDMCLDLQEPIDLPNIEKGSLKPDITAPELEDGTVPGAIVKCIDYLYEYRELSTDMLSALSTSPSPSTSSPFASTAHDENVQDLQRRIISAPKTFKILPDQYTVETVTKVLLHLCHNRLQPPLFSRLSRASKQLSVMVGTSSYDKMTHLYHIQQVLEQLPVHRYKLIKMLSHYLHVLYKEEKISAHAIFFYFSVEESTFVPLYQNYNWIFRVRSGNESLKSVFDIHYQSDDIAKNSYRCILGTSMIQLMYEIRKRLQNPDSNTSPLKATSPGTTSYIPHNGIEEIDRILKKLCAKDQNNAKVLKSLERAEANTPEQGTSPESASEAKRKRAKERQAKLLAQFATRQKAFESMMESEEMSVATEQDGIDEQVRDSSSLTCIICGVQGQSTETDPFGIFAMCQPTALLLHRTPQNMDRAIMEQECEAVPTFYSTASDHYTTLNTIYTPASAWQSFGLQAQPGIHIQSCSHYFHMRCYNTYRESQQPRSIDPLHNPLAGKEIHCPVCRRISNSAIPIPHQSDLQRFSSNPGVEVPVCSSTQIPLPFTHSCSDASYHSTTPTSCLACHSNNLTAQLKQVEKDAPVDHLNSAILKATKTEYYNSVDAFTGSLQEYYTKYVHQKSISRLDIILLSVHNTIQCELLDENDNFRKYSTGQLLQTLITASNHLIESQSHNSTILQLISIICKSGSCPSSSSASAATGDVPLVLLDPYWILLKFILFSKSQKNWQTYTTVVRLLYTLLVTRTLMTIASRFSPDEQLAWVHKISDETSTIECLIGVICKELSEHKVGTGVNEMDITSYVRTLQSVEASIQEGCMPFLQSSVLLGYHLYKKPLPSGKLSQCTFTQLAGWFTSNSTDILGMTGVPRDAMMRIARELFTQLPTPSTYKALPKTVLPLLERWSRPRLLNLPKLYGKLYLHYRNIQCKVCRQIPSDPALCLICGELVCVKSSCCTWLNKGECTKHAQKCGAGTAIYLVIMSSTVVILRGERIYLWGSVYLDQHDEEDIDLRRGKPLYLSETRYECLNQQWIAHSFDHTLKRWGWHQQLF